MRAVRVWAIAPLAVALMSLAVPYLWTHGVPAAALALRSGFAFVCHQRPERSFWLFGAPVAVCARCLGVYVGAAIGLLVRASRRFAMRALIIVAAANVIDGAAEFAGLHGNWMVVRFSLGLALGAAGAMVIAASVAECCRLEPARAA